MAALKVTPPILYTMLALAGGTRHGYAILADVEQRSGGSVKLGPSSLYYTLGRLADEGLIEERDNDGTDQPHADQRRCFGLTDAGREWIDAELAVLRGLVDQGRELGFGAEG